MGSRKLRRGVERRGHDGDAVGQCRELRRVGRRREEPCDDVLRDADQRVEERKDSHVVCLAALFCSPALRFTLSDDRRTQKYKTATKGDKERSGK